MAEWISVKDRLPEPPDVVVEWSGVSMGTLRGWLYHDRVAKRNSPSLKRVADVLRVSVEELRERKAREER